MAPPPVARITQLASSKGVEQQLILRVPADMAGDIESIIDGATAEADALAMKLYKDGTGVVRVNNTTRRAKLVNLPSIVEMHKTFDGGNTIYKSGDVHQMVVVEGGEVPDFEHYQSQLPPNEQQLNEFHKQTIRQNSPSFQKLLENPDYPSGLTMPTFTIRQRIYFKKAQVPRELVREAEYAVRQMMRAPGKPVVHEKCARILGLLWLALACFGPVFPAL